MERAILAGSVSFLHAPKYKYKLCYAENGVVVGIRQTNNIWGFQS